MRPPTLRAKETRAATRLELFFDLAFVLTIAELATTLLHDLTWAGVGEFTGLFTLIWLSWVGFTLYANRFDTDDVLFRIATFVAMLTVLGCAASVSEATGSRTVAFTLSYLLGRAVLALLYLRAWRHVRQARPTIALYLAAMTAVAALWSVSLSLPSPGRYLVWGVAVLVDIAAPILATRRPESVPLHLAHLPERFGLLVILVLGGVITAIVTAVHDTAWAPEPTVVAVVGFVLAAAVWWNYFDVSAAVGARALQRAESEEADSEDDEGERANPGNGTVDERHDLFIYGHLPLTLGIAAAGVGLEDVIANAAAPLPSAGSRLLVAGLVVVFIGAGIILGGARQRLREVLLWPSTALPALLAIGWLTPSSALHLTMLLAGVALLMAGAGTVLSHRASRR